MVELAHHQLGRPAQAVVQGGDAVQQDQGQAVDGHADDLPRVAVEAGHDQQPDGADAGQQGTDQVRPGVEPFSVIHATNSAPLVL
ncbi:hypothetical protein D3C78_1819130 [compost metagenome]